MQTSEKADPDEYIDESRVDDNTDDEGKTYCKIIIFNYENHSYINRILGSFSAKVS